MTAHIEYLRADLAALRREPVDNAALLRAIDRQIESDKHQLRSCLPGVRDFLRNDLRYWQQARAFVSKLAS